MDNTRADKIRDMLIKFPFSVFFSPFFFVLRSLIKINRSNMLPIYINKIQQDATDAGFYYCKLTVHVSGRLSAPSSGVHQTVTTVSGTGHITYHGNDLLA